MLIEMNRRHTRGVSNRTRIGMRPSKTGEVPLKPGKTFWNGLEGINTPFASDEPRSNGGEISDVRAYIENGHAGLERALKQINEIALIGSSPHPKLYSLACSKKDCYVTKRMTFQLVSFRAWRAMLVNQPFP